MHHLNEEHVHHLDELRYTNTYEFSKPLRNPSLNLMRYTSSSCVELRRVVNENMDEMRDREMNRNKRLHEHCVDVSRSTGKWISLLRAARAYVFH